MNKYLLSLLGVAIANWTVAQPPEATKPIPVPLTRPDMKQALEELKGRKPRFDLPPPTDEERANAGERGLTYEGRLRSLYLNTIENRGSRPGVGFGSENEAGHDFVLRLQNQTLLDCQPDE
jgi:hypothetical protein